MKLLEHLDKQIRSLGPLRRAWFTTFSLDIAFFERHVLPTVLGEDIPQNRRDFENLQLALSDSCLDVRVFCDLRMFNPDQLKRTSVSVHGVLPGRLDFEALDSDALYHPKVIFLEAEDGRMILGAGSANLTVSGWGRQEEVFIFRPIACRAQHQQVMRFFHPLILYFGLQEPLKKKRGPIYVGQDDGWRFMHSFERQTFLDILLDEGRATRLTVWSPYFSADLAGLLNKVREYSPKLGVALVPDLLNNSHIRTQWSPALARLVEEGRLSFHNRPAGKPADAGMTHAKLWHARGKRSLLAIGSWNFTVPGTASLDRPNVEAGILIDVPARTDIAGSVRTLHESDFCTLEQLAEDALSPEQNPLPFDLTVIFDWKSSCYEVSGRTPRQIQDSAYCLRLPGIDEPRPLSWRKRRHDAAWPLDPLELNVADNQALLADHSYEVWKDHEVVFRGLVEEHSQQFRPAQGYGSLVDLFNDLVNGIQGRQSTTTRPRGPLLDLEPSGDEAQGPAGMDAGKELSYFRVFQAFEALRAQLHASKGEDDLMRLLFVDAGCVREVVAMVNERISKGPAGSVMNWFLAQECLSLQRVARSRIHGRKKLPAQWDTLAVSMQSVALPAAAAADPAYMAGLKEMCAYAE